MKPVLSLLPVLTVSFALAAAEVPPPQGLLPDDTLVVLTVPNVAKARVAYGQSAEVQLWNDPAMKPFREKFEAKWKSDVVEPLQKELNVKFADYEELAQGQFTLAVVRNGWTGTTNPEPALLVLLDSGSKSEQLAKNLADLRKKWSDSGKQTRIEKIRDIDFSVLALSSDDLSKPFKKVFGGDDGEDEKDAEDAEAKASHDKKEDLFIGQSGSVLLIGDNTKVLEKVLAKLAGGSVSTLSDHAGFESANQRLNRDALAFGWVDAKAFLDAISSQFAKEDEESDGPTFFPSMSKVLPALGLNALRSLAFSVRSEDDGSLLQFFIGAPASERSGLLKILAVEEKEASPPSAVPAEVMKFQRVRMDLAKVLTELESMIRKIAPRGVNPLEAAMTQIGKDKDPNFDFRKTLMAGLGDDVITYQRAPKGTSLKELSSAPSLVLVGSPDTEKLVLAFKAVTVMLPPQLNSGGQVKEREFLGRKIYSLSPQVEGVAVPNAGLQFAACGSYLAVSSDPAMVEEFIRSSESPGKALRDRSGLLDAAQKVGGPGTGWFGFSDEALQMRAAIEALRQSDDGSAEASLLPTGALGLTRSRLKDWFDVSLLPEFAQISKYFYITVHSGSANADGLSFKYFTPRPPELKK